MKKVSFLLATCITMLILGCRSEFEEKSLAGFWRNETENCDIQLNADSTFQSNNLPLDVINRYYLSFDKSSKHWSSVWSLVGVQVKLVIGESYYLLDLRSSFPDSEPGLSVTLTDESGGSVINFTKSPF